MNFLEEIREIGKKKSPKWVILKEDFLEEMEEMQKLKIPVSKQIELIIKHTSIDKMTEPELRNIIKKHFSKSSKTVTNKIKTNPNPKPKTRIENYNKPPKSANEILEEDIDLRNFSKK